MSEFESKKVKESVGSVGDSALRTGLDAASLLRRIPDSVYKEIVKEKIAKEAVKDGISAGRSHAKE